MWANFPGVDFLRTALKFRKRKKNSSSLLYVLHKTWNWAFSRRSLLWRRRNVLEKCAARAGLLFYLIKLYATFTFPVMHHICPPKFCVGTVFNFSWDGCNTQEKWKTKVMQNLGVQIRCIVGNVKVAYCFFDVLVAVVVAKVLYWLFAKKLLSTRVFVSFFAVLLQVGLQILPLDGNPHKTMALIAHPEGVSLFS